MGFRSRFLVGLSSIVVLVAVILSTNTRPVYADSNLHNLCVPQSTPISSEHREPAGWLQLSIINRATIRVRITGTEPCLSPSGLRMPNLHPGGVTFPQVADGDYYDPNINDGFDYRLAIGDDSRDDSRIDQLKDTSRTSDTLGGNDIWRSVGDIRDMFSTGEYTFGIEEDAVQEVTCSDKNENFSLDTRDARATSAPNSSWKCRDDIGSVWGFRIANWLNNTEENFNIVYNYVGSKVVHVARDQQSDRTFTWCETLEPNQFRTENCTGDLTIVTITDSRLVTPSDMEALDTGTGRFRIVRAGDLSGGFNTDVAGPNSMSAQVSPTVTGGTASGSQPSCESEGGALAWILCPVVRTLVEALDALAKGPLADLLRYDSLTTDTGDSNPIFRVWQSFVRIANVLFIFAFMAVIFSQALSLNIDAYTVKRMLPRVVIGIILVQISFFAASFVIDVFNVLGAGVAGLILAPIEGMPSYQALIFPVLDDNRGGQVFTNLVGGALAIQNLAALGLAAAGLLWALVAILPTVLFIILAVVLTLIIRNALIAACIVFMPIALVAWILPNTERLFRQWGEVFIKALVMFPLIMGMLAIGKFAGALIVADGEIQNGRGDIFNTIASILVVVIPYLVIPFSYKLAGRAIGGIGNMFLRARGLKGAAGGGRGGGGGGGGGPGGWWRNKIQGQRARWAAGVGRGAQGRYNPMRFLSQRPRGWTANPLRGIKPGQLKNVNMRNLRGTAGPAVRGAFGGFGRASLEAQRRASQGDAEQRFNQAMANADKDLEASGIKNDKDAMEAIRLGKRGLEMLRRRNPGKATRVEELQQKYAQFMKPEYQLAAAHASLMPDPGAGDRLEDSESMLTYQVIADMFRRDPRRAANEVKKLAVEAGKNGRVLQSTYVYDDRDGQVKLDGGKIYNAARGTDEQVYTTDRNVAMRVKLANSTAADLVGTHTGSANAVAANLLHNIHTGNAPGAQIADPASPTGKRAMQPDEIRANSALQVGELLASDKLEPNFRRQLESIHQSFSDPASPYHNPALYDQILQTMENLRGS